MAAVAPLEDEYSLVQIIGNHSVNVDGLAPRNLLQNIHGLNWPKPPLSIEHVTYTYIKPEDSAFLQQLADEWEADFAEHAVRVDKHKPARLVYHAADQHLALVGKIPCMIILEDVKVGPHAGKRFLRLVHTPEIIHRPVKKEGAVKKEGGDKKPAGTGLIAFSQPSQ